MTTGFVFSFLLIALVAGEVLPLVVGGVVDVMGMVGRFESRRNTLLV